MRALELLEIERSVRPIFYVVVTSMQVNAGPCDGAGGTFGSESGKDVMCYRA